MLGRLKRFLEERGAFKNLRRRVVFWAVSLALLLLVDEKLKEGYWFNPRDVTELLTHEMIIVTLLVVALAGALLGRVGARGRGNT